MVLKEKTNKKNSGNRHDFFTVFTILDKEVLTYGQTSRDKTLILNKVLPLELILLLPQFFFLNSLLVTDIKN